MNSSTTKYFETEFDNLHIDRHELYLLMGYGDNIPSEVILDIIDEAIAEISPICKPYCGYYISDGEVVGRDKIKIDNTTLSPGAIITTALRGSDRYALFTATIGKEFDTWLDEQKQSDDIVKLFVGNTLGSILAESVVERLKEQLEEDMAAHGLLITNNYSPGYCDWALTEQRLLFSILPADVTRISLTESCLMLPIKSVSGIVGVGKQARKRAYHCDICKMENCVKRQKSKLTKKQNNYDS